MTYEEAAAYILELPKFTKKNEPAHTRELMYELGDPQESFAYIHVAGSNGKGSVCAYLTQVMIASCIRVGTFTSPHLVDIRERFCLQGKMCSRGQFLWSFERVRQAVERMQDKGLAHPTFFEYVYAMAMVIFAKEKVQCAVVETGLGGRLDATNVIRHPVLSVITSISLEHTEILGSTVEQIAAEKAGIIKSHVPVVFDGNDKDAAAVIRHKAEELNAPLSEITKESIKILLKAGKMIDFSLVCEYDVKEVKITATAFYQVMNGALALAAVNELCNMGNQEPKAETLCFRRLKADTVARGFEKTLWPGRMEEVLPEVYLDGAHNVSGIQAFLEAAKELAKEKAILLFSMVREKDYEKVVELLCQAGIWEEIILTEIPDNVRALQLSCLLEEFEKQLQAQQMENNNSGTGQMENSKTETEGVRVLLFADAGEAYRAALAHRRPGQQVFCVGSLYLIGAIKETGGTDDD